LNQAITRQSAINENRTDSPHSFQTLELVGDAHIKSSLATILYESHPHATPEQIHNKLEPLISNRGKMIEIAKTLQLDAFLQMGGETLNDKMRVDAVEAIIGAVAMDCYKHSKKGKGVYTVVRTLWGFTSVSHKKQKKQQKKQQKKSVNDVSLKKKRRQLRHQLRAMIVRKNETLQDFQQWLDANFMTITVETSGDALFMSCINKEQKKFRQPQIEKFKLLITRLSQNEKDVVLRNQSNLPIELKDLMTVNRNVIATESQRKQMSSAHLRSWSCPCD